MSEANVLITGASGQVGSALVRLAERRGIAVAALTRQRLDISDRAVVEAAIAEHAPAVVINCAAYTDVDGAEDHPDDARAVNARGPEHIATACARAGVPLIHISTDYVFDGTAGRPYREDDVPNPVSEYGRTKLEGEEAVRRVLDRHLIVRTSWVFAREHRNFVTAILRLVREGEELQVVADQVGSPTPAVQLAETLLNLSLRARADDLPWGTYHVAGSPPASRFELAEAVVRAARRGGVEAVSRRAVPVASSAFPTRARRPANSSLDCSKARMLLGVPAILWEEALRGVVVGDQ